MVLRRSIRMVEPRLFFCPARTFLAGAGMLSVRGHPGSSAAERASRHPQLSRWTRPCFSHRAAPGADPALRRHALPIGARLGRVLRVTHSTPQTLHRDTSRIRFMRAGCGLCSGPWRPVPSRPDAAQNQGRTSPSPAASKAWRSGHFGTLVGATGGTQTHSRRTG